MINNKKHTLYLSILAIICLCFSIPTSAQKKKKKKNTVSTACLACLNSFSPETLTFTTNANKCTRIVANCNKSNLTGKCEEVINDCFAYNCTTPTACADEISNRGLLYGCLKAENIFLPYQCASYISGLAKSYADQIQANLDAEERAHEQQLKQQEAQIAAEKRAAEQAAAEAKAKVAQAEADAKARQAEIEAQAKLKEQQLAYELEQKAKEAEIAREKKAQQEARNNKPSVRYNNILSTVKKDISTAKTHTSKAFNLLGIQKTTEQPTTNTPNFTSQLIEMDPINLGTSAKAKSLVNGSKYRTRTTFKCTKDTKESYIKNELKNALDVLTRSRNNLSTSISELEALNADDEVSGTISEDKINTLYEVQNKLTETINTIEPEIATLTTSCETRCKGMDVLSFNSGGSVQFDDNGLIIEESSSNGDYSCKDFEKSDSNDLGSLLFGSSSDMSSMMGGIGQKVSDLTKRVTIAVLQSDRALEAAEIAVLSGSFTSSSNTNNAVINSCIEYTLDKHQYISCIKKVINSQLSILAKYPSDSYNRDENYETTLQEFALSVGVAEEFIGCKNECPTECDDLSEFKKARACATVLSEKITQKEKGITTSGIYIQDIYINKDNKCMVQYQSNGTTQILLAQKFADTNCSDLIFDDCDCSGSSNHSYPQYPRQRYFSPDQMQQCRIVFDDGTAIIPNSSLPKKCKSND